MKNLDDSRIKQVSVGQVDQGKVCSDFKFLPDSLRQSIASVGILQPLLLVPQNKRYEVICGIRRLQIAKELSLQVLPARILMDPPSSEDCLRIALEDNRPHREYTEFEKATFLNLLYQWEVDDDLIIDQYMPILNLPAAKKTLLDYLTVNNLPDGLKQILNELNVPIRTFWTLTRWGYESQAEAETFIRLLRPGANKLKEALEWIGEIAEREGISPKEIFHRKDFQKVLQSEDPRYSMVRTILFALRYPHFESLRKEVWLALDELKLAQGTRIQADQNFEKDDIQVELTFRTLDELLSQIEKLSLASHSQAMQRLIDIFQRMH